MVKRIVRILLTLLILSMCLCGCSKEEEEEPQIFFPALSSYLSETDSYSNRTPVHYEIREEESMLEKQGYVFADGKAMSDGYWWLANKTNNGTPAKVDSLFLYTYDIDGNLLARNIIPTSTTKIAAQDAIYQYYGQIEPGAIFYPERVTRYGADCGGCGINADGTTQVSVGIGVSRHSVRQYDGSWDEGVTYEGYYMVATSSRVPLCTVIEISNHNFSGEGIEPGVPFKALVVDRGVGDNKIDLFVGSESYLNRISVVGRNKNLQVTILSLGSVVKANGHRGCRI